MERKKPLERKTGLQRSPEAAAAFQQRARGSLARSNGRPRQKRPEAQPTQPKPKVRFKARRPARKFRCSRRRCPRKADHWHHWLGQQHIKAYVRSLRLRDEVEERRRLRQLLRDPRNLGAQCDRCHMDGEHSPWKGFTAEEVPESAHEFAAELGPEWAERLRRAYPAAGSPAAATQEGAG